MPVDLKLGPKSAYCGPQDSGWLVQNPGWSESLILDRFSKIVLEHPTLPITRSTDHDVAQPDVVLGTWSAAANADHEANTDVGEAVQHVSWDTCCKSCAILPVRQNGDNNIVFSHPPQRVVIVIVGGYISR